MPLLFRYERKYLYASLGGTIDYYSHTKWIWTPEEDTIETSNWRPNGISNSIKFGVMTSVGVQFRISNKMDVFFEANVSASDIFRDPVNKKYYFFWNHLLGTGVTFKL
ncbi:MAG: hypothetical protein IPI10_18085 [Bacteroidetes bacterium]|nr:hypothetical protein [Bacteroidota bacterium]